MFENAHAKIYIYNATAGAYVSLSRSPMGYMGSNVSVTLQTHNVETFNGRTALEVRLLNQNNTSTAFSGGNFDSSWDPGANTNGHERAYVVFWVMKVE